MNNKIKFGIRTASIMTLAVALSTAAYRVTTPDEPSFPTEKVMLDSDGKFPLTVDN